MTTAAPWTDGHLDLAYLVVNGADIRTPVDDPRARCVSLPALRAAGVATVFGTIYTAPGDDGPEGYRDIDDVDGAERAGLRQLEVYEELAAKGEIAFGANDPAGGRGPRVILLMEGADPIRDPAAVPAWVGRGLRGVGLTWARGTRYAGGNASGGPLTPAGIALVEALDAAGIVHDASHLSDHAFDGLFERARGPIVATHSNARALIDADDERHLRDDQIRAIGERGGVVGLNLYGRFLARGRPATLDDAIQHVEYIAEVMGHRRGVGLGSDMDGGFPPSALPTGLQHPRELDQLTAALSERGWSDDDVAGFRCGNWARVVG